MELASALHTLVAASDQGEVFVDRARVVSRFAALSVEPDDVVVLCESLRSGRVRYVPSSKKQPDRYTEIEGAPDVIVEVVSDGSVRKDTQRLPPLYARAGIPELWLADTRGQHIRFDVHVLRGGFGQEENHGEVRPQGRTESSSCDALQALRQ